MFNSTRRGTSKKSPDIDLARTTIYAIITVDDIRDVY